MATPTVARTARQPSETSAAKRLLLEAALRHISPACAFKRWFAVGAAIFTETGGRVEGLDLFDQWLARSPRYKGVEYSKKRWRYYNPHCPRPCTLATLRHYVEEEGTPWATVRAEAEARGEQ